MDVQPPASRTSRLAPTDNGVGSRADLLEGTAIPAEGVAARTRIPTGHKVATRAIAEGAPVVKYDQVIGFATQAIAAGDHRSAKRRGGKGGGSKVRSRRSPSNEKKIDQNNH